MRISLGTRHTTLTNIAIQMKAEGRSRLETLAELHRLNTNECEPFLRVAELTLILVAVYGAAQDTILK